jgi:hypothetical protein
LTEIESAIQHRWTVHRASLAVYANRDRPRIDTRQFQIMARSARNAVIAGETLFMEQATTEFNLVLSRLMVSGMGVMGFSVAGAE